MQRNWSLMSVSKSNKMWLIMSSNYSWEKPIEKSLWISSMLLDSNSTLLFITNKVSLLSVPTFLISNKLKQEKQTRSGKSSWKRFLSSFGMSVVGKNNFLLSFDPWGVASIYSLMLQEWVDDVNLLSWKCSFSHRYLTSEPFFLCSFEHDR